MAMKKMTIVLLVIWAVLAIVDIFALFMNVPMLFGIAFGVLNVSIILGMIPLFVQEFKDRKYKKWAEMQPKEEEEPKE